MIVTPLKITFDKNVYEFIVHPEKEGNVSPNERLAFKKINQSIISGSIIPFISETILTYETVGKMDRSKVLTHPKPIVTNHEGTLTTISSNPEIHPGNHLKDDHYLNIAIQMGFKILPDKRFGKLVNPAIKNEWYYYLNEYYLETGKRFSEIVQEIQQYGAGYSHLLNLITTPEKEHFSRYDKLKYYTGDLKKLSKAIAEWSDGDSVALHITYGLDLFCTKDEGKTAGQNSVFSTSIYQHLNNKFGFMKASPLGLNDILSQ